MNRIAFASEKERKAIFTDTSAIKNIPVEMVEKDFWVCWTLERLFSSAPLRKMLRFKGGTSLSKIFSVIQRFSEDIDLILDWRIVSDEDPMLPRSNNKQNEFNKKVNDHAAFFIANDLKASISTLLGDLCTVNCDPNTPHILQVKYPGAFPKNYLIPNIRLEVGPLAAWVPHDIFPMHSYVAEAHRELELKAIQVPTICAERTFWEKATILHHEHHRPITSVTPSRYSRHYYDLYMMGHSSIKDAALKEVMLLDAVADFKKKFYPRNWARYDLARIGTLRLLPSEKGIKALADDYKAMAGMIFGKYPIWNDILEYLAVLEHEINNVLH